MAFGREVFVGREREITELTAALDDALAGRGRLVMLAGEPGIGKTRTAAELASLAEAKGFEVLRGRCPEERGAPPYWPWAQVIRALAGSSDWEALRRQMGVGADDIAAIVPEIRERLTDPAPARVTDDPDAARFLLFGAVAGLFERASQQRPLLIVLDDLHRADGSSVRLLEFVAQETGKSRILMLGTYRDTEVARDHPLFRTLGELNRQGRFHRLLLRGLDEAGVAGMIAGAGGIDPSADLADLIHHQTEGNPFFVKETVQLLAQDGMLAPERMSDLAGWRFRLPEGVREVVGRRLSTLSDDCNELLRVVAVLGREFGPEAVNAVVRAELGPDAPSVERTFELIEEALATKLVDELPGQPGHYQFTHALVQQTLLAELSLSRRVRLHAKIAVALEELFASEAVAHAEELAYHYGAAETLLGSARAVKYCALAGEQALAAFAYEDAVAHFRKAWELKGSKNLDGEAAAILFGLGRGLCAMYKLDEAFRSLSQAFDYYVQAGDTARATELAKYPAPLYWTEEHLEFLTRAVQLVPADSLDGAAVLSRYAIAAGFSDYASAIEAFDRTLVIARRERDLLLEIVTLTRAGELECRNRKWDAASQKLSEAIKLTARHRVALAEKLFLFEPSIHYSLVVRAIAHGDLKSADRHASECLAGAQKSRQWGRVRIGLSCTLWMALVRGDWGTCRALLIRINEMSPVDSSLMMVKAFIDHQTGDADAGDAAVQEAVAVIEHELPKHVTGFTDVAAASDLAHIARTAGRPDLRNIVHEFLDAAATSGRLPAGKALEVDCALAVLAVLERDAASADPLYKSLQSADGVVVGGVEIGVIPVSVRRIRGLLLGVLGRHEQAEVEFEGAMEFCRNAGYLPELAWTCHDYADMLLGQGAGRHRERVTELVHEGAPIAADLGMKPLVSRFARLWDRLTEDPTAGTPASAPVAGSTDKLTGLADRRQLLAILALDLELLRSRSGGLAVIQLDLDDFGAVNEAHGVPAGDALLKEVARTLTAAAGPQSTVCRKGGDEYVVVLRYVDAEGAVARANELVKSVLRTSVQLGPERMRTSCTAGVFMAPANPASPDVLLALSDESLRLAKEAGSNGARFYVPEESRRAATVALRAARLSILSALEEDRFILYRMPIFRIKGRSISHYEVLVRMRHPEGRIVLPGEFIPQAETLDLIQLIDRRVIERTLERWRSLADAGQELDLDLTINISARSVGTDIARFIAQQADRNHVPHDRLTFEITETSVMRDESKAEGMVTALRAGGFKVAVDDFGSGATSLKKVRSLAFDYLKLDGSLIKNLAASTADREFVAALARLAHELKLEIVAEFVSDEETLGFLAEQGVEYAQGFYLGRPEEFPPVQLLGRSLKPRP